MPYQNRRPRILTALAFLAIVCAVIPSVALAWWDKGHMIVAEIAQERLHEDVRIKVEHLIDVMREPCPDSTTFIEAACWLDDVCNRGVALGWVWHGSSRPYDPEMLLSLEDKEKIIYKLKKGNDGVAAIEKCIETLSSKTAGEWEKAFMLRVLLHVVGDIHCPMHCITKFSEEFPQGDHGGCNFALIGPATLAKKNLHGLWDSIILLDSARDFRPLNHEALHSIEKLSEMITTMYPEDSVPEKSDRCVEHWAQESYNAGVEAYLGLEPNTEPSEEYLEKSRATACKRLALAGYRLADILNACFSN